MYNFRLLFTLLDQNKGNPCKEEIYFLRPQNLYPAPEISNPNLNFKLRWARKSPVGTSELFFLWGQL